MKHTAKHIALVIAVALMPLGEPLGPDPRGGRAEPGRHRVPGRGAGHRRGGGKISDI